jgi:hypothetical protein
MVYILVPLLLLLSGCIAQPQMLTAPATQPLCVFFCAVNINRTEDTVSDVPALTTLTLGSEDRTTTTSANSTKTDNSTSNGGGYN